MPDINVKTLSQELRDAIGQLEVGGKLESSGVVTRVGDGVAWIYGLRDAGYAEAIQIEGAAGARDRPR